MLTDEERDMLDFAGTWWKHEGLRAQAIREKFGVSMTRYLQRLNALIERPEALMYAPTTVRRYQRLRQVRSSQRRAV